MSRSLEESQFRHDVQTPLAVIVGFAETLIQYGDQLPAEERRSLLAKIKAQAEHVMELVEAVGTP